MSVAIPVKALQAVSTTNDPKKAIMEMVSSHLDRVHVMYNMVLVGTYIRPEKTAGGIIRPGINVQEDVWQGKVGLVLKLGPKAFQDDADTSFDGEKAEVGEWCVYKVGDAWSLNVGEYPCRLVKDSAIKLKVDDPSVIF